MICTFFIHACPIKAQSILFTVCLVLVEDLEKHQPK